MDDTQKVETPAASTTTQNQTPAAQPVVGKKHNKKNKIAK